MPLAGGRPARRGGVHARAGTRREPDPGREGVRNPDQRVREVRRRGGRVPCVPRGPGEALENALRLLAGHREHLVSSLDWIEQVGLSQLDAIQYFHAEDKIRDTVVGIAAGIALQSSGNRQIPILAFAYAPDGVKVSARASRELVARGLDLAAIMREASKKFGGEGGGHHGAAGATIPRGTEVEFAKAVDSLVKAQLSTSGAAN